jgi:hypothetical protein
MTCEWGPEMAEPEEIIQEVKLKLDEVQASILDWKGRAIALSPALKVALDAIQKIEWVLHVMPDRTAVWVCPWCKDRTKRMHGEDQLKHAPDCERQIAIKVLEEVIGK